MVQVGCLNKNIQNVFFTQCDLHTIVKVHNAQVETSTVETVYDGSQPSCTTGIADLKKAHHVLPHKRLTYRGFYSTYLIQVSKSHLSDSLLPHFLKKIIRKLLISFYLL